MESKGVKFTYASAADMKKWVNLPSIRKNQNTWLKEVAGLGAHDPERILKAVFKINYSYLAKER